MALKISNKYDDIIHLPRPESKHPHMSNSDRAKIFSPFAALKGHTEAIHSKETPRVNRIDLSEGMYLTLSGTLRRIDSIARILEIDDYKINFDDILDITPE